MNFMLKGILCAGTAAALTTAASADIAEGFDDITTLDADGWHMQNNSSTAGTTDWFQGNDAVFPAHSGAATSYIGANFNNTNTGTISNWLVTPEVTLNNGDTFSFYARASDGDWADRLQFRLSTAGSSTDVGTGPNDVGDFTTLSLDINPDYQQGVFINEWVEYTVTVSGLAGATQGRGAFRYFVEDAGPFGNNSDYIGIDTFTYTSIPAPGALALLGLAGIVSGRRRR